MEAGPSVPKVVAKNEVGKTVDRKGKGKGDDMISPNLAAMIENHDPAALMGVLQDEWARHIAQAYHSLGRVWTLDEEIEALKEQVETKMSERA